MNVNRDLLAALADAREGKIILNFFDDALLGAAIESAARRAPNRYTLFGYIEGIPLSNVVIVVEGDIVVGNVTTVRNVYQIRFAGDSTHVVREIDQSAFPPEAEPIRINMAPDLPEIPPPTGADVGDVIDVMVVYTGAAAAGAGGTSAMNSLIQLAIDETNQSYANSGITQRLRLVHTEQVNYTESGSLCGTGGSDLERLVGTSDGFMDNVHGLRDTYSADLVSLITEAGDACGCAYLMSSVSAAFVPYAFSVVRRDCATGYYSFGHELGHNMGARHDCYVDTATTPYAYAHGYIYLGSVLDSWSRWRTIMSYNNQCTDTYPYTSCTRLPYWSSPDVSYNGHAMGTVSGACQADNAQTLDNTAYTVANFRTCAAPPSLISPSDGSTGVSTTPILDWSDVTGAISYDVEVCTDNGCSSVVRSGNVTSSQWTVSPGLGQGTQYYWRARTIKSCGSSSYTGTWSFTTSGSCATPGTPSNPWPANGATGISTSPILSWAPCADTDSYDVYFGTSSSPPYSGNTTSPSYPRSGLSNNTIYYWKVVAKNSCGNSTSGPVWSFTTVCLTPGTPSLMSPSGTGISITPIMDWSDVSGASTYDVQVCGDSNCNTVVRSQSGLTTSQWSVTPALNQGTQYWWRARASNACGPGSWPTTSLSFTTIGVAPSPPTNVLASDSTYTDRVQVTWTASAMATSYTVYRATYAYTFFATSLGTTTGVVYDDTTATPGVVYYYWVKASNAFGTSDFSTYDAGSRSTGIPLPPMNVSASDGTYTDRVQVTWTASAMATSYTVYRGTYAYTFFATSLETTTGVVYDDTTATPGVVYYYWVKASNTLGTSDFSAYDTGSRSSGIPLPPTNVSASDGTYTDRVQVAWTASAMATSYTVYRGSNSYTFFAASLGTTTGTTYDDTTATPGVVYYYWVKASNTLGASDFSAYDTGSRSNGIPVPPANVQASDKTYTDRVQVTWTASAMATSYTVYRGTYPYTFFAASLSTTTGVVYDDTSATPGVVYYYWVKASNTLGTSDFSAYDVGSR